LDTKRAIFLYVDRSSILTEFLCGRGYID